MEITPSLLQNFLDENGLTRSWIEKKLDQKQGTIRSWFSRKTIPIKFQRQLEVEMQDFSAPHQVKAHNILSLKLDSNDFEKLEEIALKNGLTVSQLVSQSFVEYINTEYDRLHPEDGE